MRPRSIRSACEYRPDIAATNSSRTAMLIRLILDPADEHRSGANQMRQWLSFQEHSRRGNASSHPDRRATSFGWYLYPPLSFSLWWDGTEIAWTYEGADEWYPLRGAQYPNFRETFQKVAPDGLGTLARPFLVQGMLLPGVVQIWSGYLARTAPRWALLSRGAVNIPKTQGYENFEGIVETDTWFGPLFTNVRLTRTNSPVEFHMRRPLVQSIGSS